MIKFDLLQKEAKKSEDKEAFQVLTRKANFRIGVGARLESPTKTVFFIEITANLYSGNPDLELDFLEKNLTVLRKLKKRGYSLVSDADGTVSCELTVPLKNLAREYNVTKSMIERFLK